MSTESRILDALAGLSQERDQLETERDRLTDELAAVVDDLKKIERIMRVADSSNRKAPKVRNQSASGQVKVSGMSEERQARALEIARTLDIITGPDLAEASDGFFNTDQAGKALSNLRNRGLLRQVGFYRAPGTKGLGRKQYAIVDGEQA